MLKTLLKEVKEYKLVSILSPLLMLGEVGMEMLIPLLMGRIIDEGVAKGDIGYIVKVGSLMVIAAIISLAFGAGCAFSAAKASTGFAKNLRRAMYEKIQTYSFFNIDKFSSAGLVTRLTTDVTNIQNSYQMCLRMATRAPASLIMALVMAVSISPKLSRIYLVAVLFLGGLLAYIIPHAHKHFKSMFNKYDALNERIQENIAAIREVKAYVSENYEVVKFEGASEEIYDTGIKAETLMNLMAPSMNLSVYGCIIAMSYFGARMIVNSELTTGNLMSLLTYCMNILMSLMILSMISVMITMSVASAQRITEVLNEEPDIKNPENPIMDVKTGDIEFKDVTFRYFENSEKPVLDNINLCIKAGETIGVIGGTGSAKSTLVSLISRLYDVNTGYVSVAGEDVRKYDVTALRDAVSVVLQKNVLFSGTIAENLRWGNKDATIEDCRRACQLACIDDFVENLPDKYEAHVEQGGSNFSGGQRQRLCIARALMKNPKVLILDDSTSAVDTATDGKIREAFNKSIPGTTKIIIAQRINSVMYADKIIVMDDGKINGIGSHDELLKNNEIYRDVYESQTGGDRDFDGNGGDH